MEIIISYYYTICEKCGFTDPDFEKPMSKNFPVTCPECCRKTLIQDYSIPKDTIYSDKTIRTVGQQSDANKKNMGKELCQLKESKLKETEDKKVRPFWRPEGKEGDKPLKVEKIKDISAYIEHGVKD